MKKVGVAILGLGVVGGGTYRILTDKREFYRKTQNIDVSVETVLEVDREKIASLEIADELVAESVEEVVSNPNVDIIVETIGGVTAAKDFVLESLNAGKSVVTSNKELIAKFSHELEKSAKRNNCGLYYEASCVGGVPVIRTLLDGVQSNKINSITGILNGTTNYILDKMTNCGFTYENVLKQAQELGYAEADPTADVDGYDSAYKLSVLSSIAFHTKVPYIKIFREGITSVTGEDIAYEKSCKITVNAAKIARKEIFLAVKNLCFFA